MNDDLTQIISGQARMEQKLDDLHTRLFGNGQPGAIQFLQSEIKDNEKRIGSLENKQYWMSGIGTAVGFVLGLLGKKVGGL